MNAKRDDYGRPWGTRLWPGGPILGGINWREFVEKRFGPQPAERDVHERREAVRDERESA